MVYPKEPLFCPFNMNTNLDESLAKKLDDFPRTSGRRSYRTGPSSFRKRMGSGRTQKISWRAMNPQERFCLSIFNIIFLVISF
jgi:hypothetical protein